MAENTEAAPTAGKSRLKLIILVVVVIILAVGLSIAGTLWFLGNSSGAEEPAEAEPVVFQANQYYVMSKPLVSTVQAEGRQRYAQVYIAFTSPDPEALAAVETHLPLIRSQLLAVLGSRTFTGLQTPEGRDELIAEMLATVNQTLEGEGEPPVEKVLFRNFVLQ
ncbi:flagellar basal body-associated protein FliL [Marinobacter sp.]|uniref:flagellar basal body-associated FliL family protein n=1 Tax=Marinobacter sp. TaxID=50741 RepID=UPI00384DD3F4